MWVKLIWEDKEYEKEQLFRKKSIVAENVAESTKNITEEYNIGCVKLISMLCLR